MDTQIHRALVDKVYEKRKNAALELERTVRDAAIIDDVKKLHHIIAQLCELAASPHSNARSGAIMGLAGASIALGPKIAEYLGAIVPPILACFQDSDSKVRYFACESMYNVAKVAKGEILIFFNELFDAMAKLAADTELPVKNGAELLDRLIKDIVTEQASTYISTAHHSVPPSPRASDSASFASGDSQPFPPYGDGQRAFSLARFIPLLSERIYVLNPFTRTYLVSWLTVLDSVPELELVTYLPSFLDGLLKFLGDPTVDIRTATQNVLADFLREIREVAEVQQRGGIEPPPDGEEALEGEGSRNHSRHHSAIEHPEHEEDLEGEQEHQGEDDDEEDAEGAGEWIPGQGVLIDHASIVEILLGHLSFPDEEIQSTCLRWIAEFLLFCQPTMVPLTPRLLPAILSSLAHHVASIRTAATDTNFNLFTVVQELPVISPGKLPEAVGRERTVTASPIQLPPVAFPNLGGPSPHPSSSRVGSTERSPKQADSLSALSAQFDQLSSNTGEYGGEASAETPFDYGATVNALTLQFLSEHEETRVAALEWLLMLHQKAPKRILAVDDKSQDATRQNASQIRSYFDGSESGLSIALLLKMLSDPSEKVLRCDLQLLAQISSSSEDEYFPSFMMSLLSLFSTDRRLLETRGSFIIRQLCQSLNTERIYRTFAEILEKDEDLEFASIMVQNLNLIMITSPELADFRKRLRTLESKDGQALFTVLYRSWSHNAVATFALCLLAQAYEQACALLQIFADLEITVSLLIQVDKLVQLLESPVFTSLRLQLLEPDRYPFLLKAMYGLLMLLPQSSAFATLRNRLGAVSSLGLLQTVPKSYAAPSTSAAATARSTIRRGEDIRWTELLTHFRQVQKKRSTASPHLGADSLDSVSTGAGGAPSVTSGGTTNGSRTARRKTAPALGRNEPVSVPTASRPTNGWRGTSGPSTAGSTGAGGGGGRPSSPLAKRRLASAPTTKK